jgi:nitrate/nitrite transporter NarK
VNRKWYLVGGSWSVAAVLNAYIIVPASFFPIISEQLAISSTAASWIVSIMFGIGVIASVPAGIALDRLDNRRAITIAAGVLLISGLGSWYAARMASYELLLVARALGGFTFPVIWMGSINLIGRTFDAGSHATAISIFTTSAPAGFAIGQLLGSLLASQWGWPVPFGAFAIPTGLAGGLFWAGSQYIPTRSVESSPPRVSDFRHVLTDRHVQSIAGMGFLAYSIYVFFNSWMPTYLTDQLGLSLAASGTLVAVFPAIGILSRSGSGFISDCFLSQRRQPLVVVAFGATLPLVTVIAVSEIIVLLVVCLVLAGLFVQLGIGILYTYVQELVDPTVSATALAALTMMCSLGSFTAPVVTGFLIEQTHSYVAAFNYALLIVGIGAILAYRGPEPNSS